MLKTYISDIITHNEITKWNKSDKILISSQTGTGKTEFIKNNLYQYCINTDSKILLLSNRTLLKNQNMVELEGKLDVVTTVNYQELETKILYGSSLSKIFEGYQYIVYDEAHYLFSDSQFNRNTDILLEPLSDKPELDYPNIIFIFITATPDALLSYYNNFDFVYNLPVDYSYISKIYFYNKYDTLKEIIYQIPYNDKAVFFSSNAFDAYELSVNMTNAEFICSESHRDLSKRSNKQVIKDIVNNSKFDCSLLCTTKVLDNGVNLIDDSVKHIIIDMLDPISFIQCLGRKRINNNEKINLYIHNYHGGFIYTQLNSLLAKMNLVSELESIGIDNFATKYKKKDYDNIIQNDFSINVAKYIFYNKYIHYLKIMLSDVGKIGYKKTICSLLNYLVTNTSDAEFIYEKKNLIQELELILNTRLYKDEKEKFKIMFFNNLFSPKKTNYRKRGIRSINAILEEDAIPFRVISSVDTKSIDRNQRYWMIIAL